MLNLNLLIKKIIYFHKLKNYNICLNTIIENEKVLLDHFPLFFIEVLKIYYNTLLNNCNKVNLNTINYIIDSYLNLDNNNRYKVIVNLVLAKFAYYKIQEDHKFAQNDMYLKIYNMLTTSPHSLYTLDKLVEVFGLEPINKTNIHIDERNIHIETLLKYFGDDIFTLCLDYLIKEELDE